MNQSPGVDWKRIEFEYRAGIRSLREMGAAHGVSHVAISKRAKAHEWERSTIAGAGRLEERWITRAHCEDCGVPISETKPRWIVTVETNRDRDGCFARVSYWQACGTCSEMDALIQEAVAANLRFTEIGIGVRGSGITSTGGDRCLCGSVRLASLNHCIACNRASRMLDKAGAESRLIGKALKELRAALKQRTKEESNEH